MEPRRLLFPALPIVLLALTVGASPAIAQTIAPPTSPQPAPTVVATSPEPATLAAWSPDVAAAKAFIRTRSGRVSYRLVDETTGRQWGDDAWRRVRGASLLKTLLMATYLRRAGVRDRALTAKERAMLAPMIRRSENEPAGTLVTQLSAAELNRTARAAGMGTVAILQPWGHTLTSARAQVSLFRHLPDLIPPRHRAYAMRLLRTIVASQRWGIGQARPDGWTLYLKGGWGSGTGLVDHQTALLVRGEQRLVLSIITTDNPDHERGNATLRGVALRLLRGLPE